MQVALIANTAWLDEELTTLRQLAVGLLDEQVQVAAVVPERLSEAESGAFIARVTWTESRLRWLTERRLAALAERLSEREVSLLHALDGRMWRGALRLGQAMDVPMVLSASSWFDVALAQRLASRLVPERTIVTAATVPLLEALREKLPPEIETELVQPGLHRVEEDETQRLRTEAISVIISGNGVYDARYDALLRALQQVVQREPDAQFFFDGQGSDQHNVWKAARRYKLLSNVSLVPRRLGHREMLLRSDVLVHPQPLGRARSLTLRAMAHGVPVIAHDDPWLDYLIDEQTAWVLRDPDVNAWVARFTAIISDPESARDLAHAARDWVARQRPAPQHIERTLSVYRRLTGEAMRFPG